jgi:acyl-CoA synthetase (AMP-forming)/AMP-acid ligase II
MDAAFIGLPHEKFDETPKAFVVKGDPRLLDEKEVMKHVEEKAIIELYPGPCDLCKLDEIFNLAKLLIIFIIIIIIYIHETDPITYIHHYNNIYIIYSQLLYKYYISSNFFAQ